MKIYYVENLTGFGEIEQFYIVDFAFGGIVEYGLDGRVDLTYQSFRDFYALWDRRGNVPVCWKYGKEQFHKNAVMKRVL